MPCQPAAWARQRNRFPCAILLKKVVRQPLSGIANQNPPLKWNPSHFMHRHLSTPPPPGRAFAVLCRTLLVILHLTMVATAYAARQTLSLSVPISRPYLAVYGAPLLRFQEVIPPAPPAAKAISVGPPIAASTPETAEVSLANEQAAASTPPMPTVKPLAEQSEAGLPDVQDPKDSSTEKRPAIKALPILPDDTRPRVQSQDFLPLFRFPGTSSANEEISVIAPGIPVPPAPNSLPPSSATYQQH